MELGKAAMNAERVAVEIDRVVVEVSPPLYMIGGF
jgi:hypothetical protein